jgi:hypothetical protein
MTAPQIAATIVPPAVVTPFQSPIPASESHHEARSDVEAYIVGHEAFRPGIDLENVIFDAMASWPGTSREISQAIAWAAVAWVNAENRRPEP